MSAPSLSSDRRDFAWIRVLREALHAEPCPATLDAALSAMELGGVPLASPSGTETYASLRTRGEAVRTAWRAGDEWGERDNDGLHMGKVIIGTDGQAQPLLPSLGLVAPGYAETDERAEEVFTAKLEVDQPILRFCA